MARHLRERILLRRMRGSVNQALFKNQNNALSSWCNIAPEWLHLARKNYRYIYNHVQGFWPDWAIEQFDPVNPTTQHPPHELFCLNTSTREGFTFHAKNPLLNFMINQQGTMSFPGLGWGICIKRWVNNGFQACFSDSLALHPKKPHIGASIQLETGIRIHFELFFNDDYSIPVIAIAVKNPLDQPIDESLCIGVIPFTNEGVGAIRSIQYLSNETMIINDSSVIHTSLKPNNVTCINHKEGNIFNQSTHWDMILSATCDDCLASAALRFDLAIPPKKTAQLNMTIRHAKPFITPLFYPLQKINRFLFSNLKKAPGPSPPIPMGASIGTLDRTSAKLPVIIQMFLHSLSHNVATHTSRGLYFSLYALLQLNAMASVDDLLEIYDQSPASFTSLRTFSRTQNHLLNHLIIIDAQLRFRRPETPLMGRFIKSLQQLIVSDSFFKFIKKLSIKKFNAYLASSYYFESILKLMLFSHIAKKLGEHHLSTEQTSGVQSICSHFLQIILANTKLMDKFCNQFSTTTSLSLSEKLFLLHVLLTHECPKELTKKIQHSIGSSHWQEIGLLDYHNFNGIHASDNLMFCFMTTSKVAKQLTSQYMDKVNDFGQYVNHKCWPQPFSSYPSPTHHEHAILIHFLLQQLAFCDKKTLTISALLYFNTIQIDHLQTPFGPMSLRTAKKKNQLIINLSHSFKVSPKHIILKCPELVTLYSFSSDLATQTLIKNNQVNIPLNETQVTLSY